MPVGISFGSATSGTGFDVTSTVNSILAIQRTPETAWATQTTALQAQDTALSSLGTSVSALSTSLSQLTNFDGVFASKQGASSDTGSVALTSVGSGATVGSHTLTVARLATTSQQYSTAVANSATLGGTLTLTIGSGAAQTINVNAGSTVAQVAAQINSSGAGVTASVISDGNGAHLSLVSGASGAAGEISTGGSLTDSSGNTVSFTSSSHGQDAQYTVDGVSLTSGSNAVTNALTGVNFQLTGVSANPVTVQIAADTSGITTALSNFVSSYNTLAAAITTQEGKDSSGNAEPLFGSSVTSSLQTSLSNALNFSSGGSDKTTVSLSDLGISYNADGTLSLDTAALNTTLTNNLTAAGNTFQLAGGFGQSFVTTLNNAGGSGNGTIALALRSNAAQETTLAQNKTNLEARLSDYSTRLTTELNTANQILQSIPQQLTEIDSIFNLTPSNSKS